MANTVTQPFRKIIHVDMDAFYASVEQRDFPEYRGKPLVVGGMPDSRGVVAAASYEARQFGIKSAMPCSQAYRLCPTAIFVYPRFDVYKEVSKGIRSIFFRYTDLVEPLSLDEAYLDVTEDKLGIGSALEIASSIKKAIKSELNLNASAGISVNKFVAKVASDLEKPDGLTFIGPSKINSFMERLPIEKFYGIGKVTAAKMKAMQIVTGADLKRLSEAQLKAIFGKAGNYYYHVVRGVDNRPVRPHRATKSVSVEDTLTENTSDYVVLRSILAQLSETLSNRLKKQFLQGRTITLKVKFGDFTIITRSKTIQMAFNEQPIIYQHTAELLSFIDLKVQDVRLLGISISGFKAKNLTEEQIIQLEFDF
ncbi:DNA polymerase IV [Pedobacter sp. UYP30]|uniref:DNA polymerase IV n=1 Tax=Pedobacter sp. UYP30 TaxID=1756400 RepID=UPI003398A13E